MYRFNNQAPLFRKGWGGGINYKNEEKNTGNLGLLFGFVSAAAEKTEKSVDTFLILQSNTLT